ncbi:MAG: hypothetical protein EOP07_04000 [Proteobacteria bacterium]|nr:MAG: hypothetical protein EOP07_04000 [Pseudomonadota bacterium]
MIILATLLTFAFAPAPASAPAPLDRCTSLIGSCEYYSCVEEERLSCGPKGYPLGYGQKYCEKLSALEFSPAHLSVNQKVFPADGNLWRDEVRSCLQEEMDGYFQSSENASCEGLKAFAFDSHPRCYTKSISFCELTPESVIKVGLTITPQDLVTEESLRQVQETAVICGQQISDRIQEEPNLLVRLQLRKYRLIWQSVAANPLLMSQKLMSNPEGF